MLGGESSLLLSLCTDQIFWVWQPFEYSVQLLFSFFPNLKITIKKRWKSETSWGPIRTAASIVLVSGILSKKELIGLFFFYFMESWLNNCVLQVDQNIENHLIEQLTNAKHLEKFKCKQNLC